MRCLPAAAVLALSCSHWPGEPPVDAGVDAGVPCSAATCSGCCDGQTCVTVMTDEKCGRAGMQCQACPMGNWCEAGSCRFIFVDNYPLGQSCDAGCELIRDAGICEPWPGEYCTMTCDAQHPCPAAYTLCMTLPSPLVPQPICLAKCSVGLANCRPGYSCWPLASGDGGDEGTCWLARCDGPDGGRSTCLPGTACRPFLDAGACEPL